MKLNKTLIGTIIRIIIGVVFILSAVLKYLSIEEVDLFFFEHKIFNLTVTSFFSRTLIASEAILGLMLIIGIYPKLTKILTFFSLIGFTIYLLLKPLLFGVSSENCFCFGDIIRLTDTQTIIKNIILLLLALTLGWAKWWRSKYSVYILIGIFVVCLGSAYIINAPDIIKTTIYGNSTKVKEDKIKALLDDERAKSLNINQGKKVICLYSTACIHCKRMATRIDVIIDMHKLNRNNFVQIFWGNEASISDFYTKSNSRPLPYIFVNPIIFLDATYGKQPIVLLMDNGKIVDKYKYTSLNENRIVEFLNQDN